MKIENEGLFRHVLSTNINLFLGSGFSVLASDATGHRIPTGSELKSELIAYFDIDYGESLDLAQLGVIIESQNRQSFDAFLRKRFSVSNFDPRYHNLENACVKAIFTTNVDDLIFKIYLNSKRHYVNDLVLRGPVFDDRAAIDLVSLHGSIVHEDERLVFSTLDIASSFSSDPDRWHFLTNRLQQTPTLFWGYSVADAGVLQALSPRSSSGRDHKPRWIMLREETQASTLFFRALGFQIIVGSTDDMLDYLAEPSLATQLHARISGDSTREMFPKESIPSPGEVPVRSVMDFYLGAPPTWHDIFSGQVHVTEHRASVLEAIYTRRNAAVIGIPACGKTTLMMQTAAVAEYPGHKLVVSQLSAEKAAFLLNRLNGRSAIIFVDEFCSDADAFDRLLRVENVLAIGFDRDYSFEQSSHRLSANQQTYDVIEVTELSPMDTQAIYDRIPREIRSDTYQKPEMTEGAHPSVFEIVEGNVRLPHLQQRFQTILRDLARRDPILHDLLIMFCYVSACRVPVSYDTASAYLRGHFKDYEQLYEMVGKLGATVSEYFGAYVEEEQDYFVSRSTIVGETVLSGVSPSAFRRVLLRFHEQVSPIRICRYDIFRRRAFDKDFAIRAFPAWKDGVVFYEKMHARDQSPYLLQQGALYLAKKRRYAEAFTWIDRALVECDYKHISILNSHAVILFDANIEWADKDSSVRNTLDQSMRILSDCHAHDRRKTYHAMRYADQALRYSEVYHDETSREYLLIASQWLAQEQANKPWHRGIRRLQYQVQNRLNSYYLT